MPDEATKNTWSLRHRRNMNNFCSALVMMGSMLIMYVVVGLTFAGWVLSLRDHIRETRRVVRGKKDPSTLTVVIRFDKQTGDVLRCREECSYKSVVKGWLSWLLMATPLTGIMVGLLFSLFYLLANVAI